MDYIGKSGYKYVIRVQSNFSKITKDAADIDRQVTTSYKQNQEKRNIKFRVVNIALPCGEIEKIVTNLDEKFEVNLEISEISETVWLKIQDINPNDIAFDSQRIFLEKYKIQ